MSTPVQSSSIPLMLSFDGGNTYKSLVCLENYKIARKTSTTTVDTFCGRFVGLGPIASTISGSAVCETNPTASQVTQRDLENAQNAGTLVYIQANYPTQGSLGGQITNNGAGYVTASEEDFTVNNLVKFTFSIDVNGGLF